MGKIKSYTDIEQSKKLAEILPLESADMVYCAIHNIGQEIHHCNVPIFAYASHKDIPCWSLAALLGLIPKEQHPKLVMNAHYKWICDIIHPSSFVYKPTAGDNPLDAVFEMIIKLHELDLL